jgi:hypothetical protein
MLLAPSTRELPAKSRIHLASGRSWLENYAGFFLSLDARMQLLVHPNTSLAFLRHISGLRDMFIYFSLLVFI